MIYLFKNDPWGNKIPVFVAQTNKVATAFADTSQEELYSFYTEGNKPTILNL